MQFGLFFWCKFVSVKLANGILFCFFKKQQLAFLFHKYFQWTTGFCPHSFSQMDSLLFLSSLANLTRPNAQKAYKQERVPFYGFVFFCKHVLTASSPQLLQGAEMERESWFRCRQLHSVENGPVSCFLGRLTPWMQKLGHLGRRALYPLSTL